MTVEEFYKELKEEINDALKKKGLSACFEAGGQFRSNGRRPTLTIQDRRPYAECGNLIVKKHSIQLEGEKDESKYQIDALKFFKDIKTNQKEKFVRSIISEEAVPIILKKAKKELHAILEDAVEKDPFWKKKRGSH